MLLIVGFTKSVMVTVISGMKESFTLKEWSCFSFTLDKNLVFVWKVTSFCISPGQKKESYFVLFDCLNTSDCFYSLIVALCLKETVSSNCKR